MLDGIVDVTKNQNGVERARSNVKLIRSCNVVVMARILASITVCGNLRCFSALFVGLALFVGICRVCGTGPVCKSYIYM